MGAICSDGNVIFNSERRTYKCKITSNDKDWLKMLLPYFGYKLKIYKETKEGKCYRLEIFNKELVENLIKFGCVPNKSLILEFPKVPKKYLRDFIRGCWDGDGSIGLYKSKGRNYLRPAAQISSGSLSFITALKTILEHNFITSSLYMRKAKKQIIINTMCNCNNFYLLSICGETSINNLLKFIYYPNAELFMPRKMKIATKIVNYLYKRSKINKKL